MSAFGKCGGGGRRLAARVDAPLVAVFTTVTQSKAAELVDISRSGARLHGPTLPAERDEVMLSVGEVKVFGVVSWSRAGECGLAFEPWLGAEAVAQIRNRASSGRGLTVDFKSAMDHWAEGFAR